MTPARLRELAGAMNATAHEASATNVPFAMVARATADEAGDALTWTAKEIERLRVLAREGWTNFAAAASFFGNEDQAHRCATALAEIEAAS